MKSNKTLYQCILRSLILSFFCVVRHTSKPDIFSSMTTFSSCFLVWLFLAVKRKTTLIQWKTEEWIKDDQKKKKKRETGNREKGDREKRAKRNIAAHIEWIETWSSISCKEEEKLNSCCMLWLMLKWGSFTRIGRSTHSIFIRRTFNIRQEYNRMAFSFIAAVLQLRLVFCLRSKQRNVSFFLCLHIWMRIYADRIACRSTY